MSPRIHKVGHVRVMVIGEDGAGEATFTIKREWWANKTVFTHSLSLGELKFYSIQSHSLSKSCTVLVL